MISLGGRNVRLFSDFWRVLREFNPEEIAREAEQPFEMTVVGSGSTDKDTLVHEIGAGASPCTESPRVRAVDLPDNGAHVEAPTGDVIVHVVDASTGFTSADRKLAVTLFGSTRPVVFAFQTTRGSNGAAPAIGSLDDARQAVVDLFGTHAPKNVVYLDASSTRGGARSVLREVLDAVPQKQLAMGRCLPAARPRVASNVIFQTSAANAQFALLSSLPANIPIVGGLVGSGADFVVLTKNQALMVFRLAALYGKERSPKIRMVAEIAPVVGAAFMWRTIARTAVGMLPPVVSVVPKTMIAFVGTFLVGRAAQHYYATGSKPGADDLARFGAEASEAWGGVIGRDAAHEDAPSS